MQTSMNHPHQADAPYNYARMEQFAISVAALSHDDGATPHYVLNNVLETLAENRNAALLGRYSAEQLLSEQAALCGFTDIDAFRMQLLQLIRRSMIDLQISRLTALDRAQTKKKPIFSNIS